MDPDTHPSRRRRLKTKRAVALAGLAAAALVIAVVLIARGDAGNASAPRDCALAWNRTAGEEERSLLNKDAQVARGSQEERRVRVLVTAHVGDDERFTRLDGGQGVARPGCVHGDRSARHDLASSLGGPLNVPACAETATSGREVRETPGFAHV